MNARAPFRVAVALLFVAVVTPVQANPRHSSVGSCCSGFWPKGSRFRASRVSKVRSMGPNMDH